jgi:hypothetical protein
MVHFQIAETLQICKVSYICVLFKWDVFTYFFFFFMIAFHTKPKHAANNKTNTSVILIDGFTSSIVA